MKKTKNGGGGGVKGVDFGELDPPLPVVKRAAPADDSVNIWKRRSMNGTTAPEIQLPFARRVRDSRLPPPTTV